MHNCGYSSGQQSMMFAHEILPDFIDDDSTTLSGPDSPPINCRILAFDSPFQSTRQMPVVGQLNGHAGPCPFRKLYPDVSVMQSSQDGNDGNIPDPLNGSL